MIFARNTYATLAIIDLHYCDESPFVLLKFETPEKTTAVFEIRNLVNTRIVDLYLRRRHFVTIYFVLFSDNCSYWMHGFCK